MASILITFFLVCIIFTLLIPFMYFGIILFYVLMIVGYYVRMGLLILFYLITGGRYSDEKK